MQSVSVNRYQGWLHSLVPPLLVVEGCWRFLDGLWFLEEVCLFHNSQDSQNVTIYCLTYSYCMNKSARRHKKEELRDLYFELLVRCLPRGHDDRHNTVRKPTGTSIQVQPTIQRPMLQTAYKPTSLQTRYPISKLRRKYYHHPEVTTTKL